MTPDRFDVSVVVPTVGRDAQLADCLASLSACDPGPTEVVVVDQSGAGVGRAVATAHDDDRVRVVEDDGRGCGRTRNRGAQVVRSDLLLFTDDDCLVDSSWEEQPPGCTRRTRIPVDGTGDPRWRERAVCT